METEAPLYTLKTKLQNFGALRPEAWEAIVVAKQEIKLKPEESLIRKEGTLAYVVEGLLKEYNPQNRSKPAIVNFISSQQNIITRKHNQTHYLKAIRPSIVYAWDFEQLQQLYQAFKELKPIYDSFCAEYELSLQFRMQLLEISPQERVTTSKLVFHNLLPYLKKKDLANYLHLNYTHLLRYWNS